MFAESIEAIINRRLVTPNQTRWNSTFDSIVSLAELPKEQFVKIADALGLYRFSDEDLVTMDELVKVSYFVNHQHFGEN